MEEILLQAHIRDKVGKQASRQLRREGWLPAILYGEKTKSLCLRLNMKDFLKILHTQDVVHSVINLKISSDGEKTKTVVIKEIQHNSVDGEILHIDFNEISLNKAIVIDVAVVVKGEPIGVKQDGGIFSSPLWELKVECLPRKVPKNIEVDVSNMRIGDYIHVKDIILPEGIKVLNDPESVVFSVEAPAIEEVAEVTTEAPAEPEVIKQKKPEETEEKEKKEP